MESKILEAYIAGETSLRDVAEACGTNHHTVKRVLTKHGVNIVKAKRKPFTEQHKARISQSTKGRASWIKGRKATEEMLYKNMAAHLRFDVDAEWLSQFDDIDKLKTINRAITERGGRFDFDTESYKQYVLRFYKCDRFNKIYAAWVESGKAHYRQPSLDHIVPRSKGGKNTLENMQFLTWFENRCKNDLSQIEWDSIKKNIESYFI